MNVPVGTTLTRVARVIYTENRPIAYLVDTLPADILPLAEIESGFTGSVLDLLLQPRRPEARPIPYGYPCSWSQPGSCACLADPA